MQGLWSRAFRRLTPRLIAVPLFGTAVLALGGWAWLHIPDSHAWEFGLSVLLGFVLAVAGLSIYIDTIYLARRPEKRAAWWLSAMWLIVSVAIIVIWMTLVAKLGNRTELRAGYWNSQLSAHMRTVFTYVRMVRWQGYAITALIWILPLMLLPAFIERIARGVRTRGLRVWKRWEYWVVSIGALVIGLNVTPALVDWHPAYSVHGELWSAALRLLLVYVIDILLICIALAVTSELLAQAGLLEGAGRDSGAKPATNGSETIPGN
jgi:hypothetical protein